MSDSTFWFLVILAFAGFATVIIEWGYRKKYPPTTKEHDRLMREIRRHDNDD
jgi:hypothetical protein